MVANGGRPFGAGGYQSISERADELRIHADELSARRTNLTADLGALVYEREPRRSAARRGTRVLYNGIAAIDREQEQIAEELARLEEEHNRAAEAPEAARYCQFCGLSVTPEAIFCPRCGTRLAGRPAHPSPASLTGQLEEVELDEPEADRSYLASRPRTAAGTAAAADTPAAVATSAPKAEEEADTGKPDAAESATDPAAVPALAPTEDDGACETAPEEPAGKQDAPERPEAQPAAASAAVAETAAPVWAQAVSQTLRDPGATQLLPVVRPSYELLDPATTHVISPVQAEAAAFDTDPTATLPQEVEDAPDFDDTDATRMMPAIVAEREPESAPHTYRSF